MAGAPVHKRSVGTGQPSPASRKRKLAVLLTSAAFAGTTFAIASLMNSAPALGDVSSFRLEPAPDFPMVPITAAAGHFGFLISALGLFLGGLFRGRASRSGNRAKTTSKPAGRGGPEARPSRWPKAHVVTEDWTSVDVLAEAAIASRIQRIIVLSAEDRHRTPGSVQLARALGDRSATVILIDVSADRASALAMGVATDAPGIGALLMGEAPFAEAIERDRTGAANVIATGGAKPGASDRELAELLAALAEAYDCTIVDGGSMATSRLIGLMDEETALVVSMSPGFEGKAADILGALAAAGHGDTLVMQSRDVYSAIEAERRSRAA